MPSRSDIEQFKTILNSLGSEPEIRAKKQETIEDVVPPEEGLSTDISQLLDSFSGGETAAEEETGPDLSALDEAIAPQKKPAQEPETEELPDLDFASLFGEEKEPDSIDKPKTPPKRQAKAAEPRPQKEAPLKGKKPAPEKKPQEAPLVPSEPAPEEPGLDLGDITALSDLNGMETLEEGPTATEEAPESAAPVEEPAIPESGDDLVLPPMEGLEEPGAAADAVPDATTEGAETEAVETVPAEATEPGLDAFDIPEGESFEIPSEETA